MADLIKIVGKGDYGFQPYPSYYNVFNPLLKTPSPEKAKQHFVHNFVGSDYRHDIWQFVNSSGGASATMSDTIDGGLILEAGPNSNNFGYLDYSTVFRHFDFLNSVCYFTNDRVAGTRTWYGISATGSGLQQNSIVYNHGENRTFIELFTASSTSTTTATSTPIDTVRRLIKLELTPSKGEMSMNGVISATNTNNLPTVRMSPQWLIQNRGGGSGKISHSTYFEAYNI